MAVGFPTKVNYATGDVLSATNMNDLSGTVNLLESAQYAAGKNKIINGDFGVWQRGTSFTPAAGGVSSYTSDRWVCLRDGTGATLTVSQQTFTPGTAPVAGYEGQYFFRLAQSVAGTGATYNVLEQRIEDVRQFAGQIVTFSFWAKASATVSTGSLFIGQYYGSGGSSDTGLTIGTSATLTTSWQRFTYTGTLPSITGKTIGTNSYIYTRFSLPQNATFTIDIWGVQLEASSTASPFQTATGTKQGELAACQRYYYRNTPGAVSAQFGSAAAVSTTSALLMGRYPVTMRTKPTALEQSGTANQYAVVFGATNTTCSAVPSYAGITTADDFVVTLTFTAGLVLGQAGRAIADSTNGATAYLGWSAEL